jgi:rod shape-determining protein MreC
MATAKTRRRIVGSAVAVTLFVTIAALSGGLVAGLRSTGAVLLTPFTWTLNEVARPIGHVFAGAFNYSQVLNQNRELRQELGELRLQANENAVAARLLAEIDAATNLPFVGSLPTVLAPVSAQSPTNFVDSITISKGRADGVLPGMPVVANGGLVGVVTSVTTGGAEIRLITDAQSVVGATFGAGTTDALIYGRGAGQSLRVSAISLKSTLAPGTIFYTNGLQGGLFPAGFPVATVKSVTLTPGATTFDLALRPAADLRHLSYVDVVLWEPGT